MNIALKYFEDVKAQIKAEEERQVAITKDRVLREIQPKYAEIEKIKAEELNDLQNTYNANRNSATEQYNAQLVALQQNFENRKKEVIENEKDQEAQNEGSTQKDEEINDKPLKQAALSLKFHLFNLMSVGTLCKTINF